MAITRPIRIERTYKGWGYEIDEIGNNDLVVIIRPPYRLQFPRDDDLHRDEKIAEYRHLHDIIMANTYSFNVRKRYLGVFMGLYPPWAKAEQEAIDYIDKNLGVLNFDKIFRKN